MCAALGPYPDASASAARVRIRFGGGSANAELSLDASNAKLHGANLTELDAELCGEMDVLRLALQRADD